MLRPDVERLGILLDRSGGLAAYTGGYATNLLTGVLTTGTTYPRVVPAGTRDMAPVLADMLAHGSDALFYAGDGAGAARTARALAATPFKGPRMAMHTAMVPGFIEEAGDAATGWEFTAPYTDATAPAAKEFAAAHRKLFKTAPAHWAAEAHDAAGLVIEALTAFGKRPSRAALVARIARSVHQGVSRTYVFDETQTLDGKDAYLYRVENGRYRFVGSAPKTAA